MECFSYIGGCGIHECMHIEVFKRKLALAMDKRLQAISNEMSIIPLRKKRKKPF